jgi:ubiquinone/menaquinone biosynthesis C-methylase UbiE
MDNYYGLKLHGHSLKRCYEIASPRIKQYLDAEVKYLLKAIPPRSQVLELGCGYGRVLACLAKDSREIVGVDTSTDSLILAKQLLCGIPACNVLAMNALGLGFRDNFFDCVICIQNGISAFNVDQRALIQESIRVAKDQGQVFFSSYTDKIWPERLHWFELQAEAGLIGEIDWQQTRDGIIVCKDGFRASAITAERFRELTDGMPVSMAIEEVDESSVFCILTTQKTA